METPQLAKILSGTDLRFPDVIRERIKELEETKTILIQAATVQLDSYDTVVLDPLLNLSNLQTDLNYLIKDIEDYLKLSESPAK